MGQERWGPLHCLKFRELWSTNGPKFLPALNILFRPQCITHALSGINVAFHGKSKWNGIGFVCSSDSKPQKDLNLAVASRRAALSVNASLIANFSSSSNKFPQSNLGRGPRCGTVPHLRCKVPIGYNGATQISPKVPLPVDRSPNPTTCLIPGPVRHMMPNGIRIRSGVFPQYTGQTDRPTDRRTYGPTHRPTDRPRESLITIGRCAMRATRQNNSHHHHHVYFRQWVRWVRLVWLNLPHPLLYYRCLVFFLILGAL